MKIGIIACGAIVRELLAIANRRGWDYELTAVPAQLHNRPERIAPAVEKKLDAWAGRFDRILIGYGDCGTVGALDALLARYPHAVRIPGPTVTSSTAARISINRPNGSRAHSI